MTRAARFGIASLLAAAASCGGERAQAPQAIIVPEQPPLPPAPAALSSPSPSPSPPSHSWRDGYGATAPVGTYAAGASKDGAFDLSGNVSEWLASTGTTTRSAGAAGSSFNDAEERLENTTRTSPSITQTAPSLGFRCALGDAVER